MTTDFRALCAELTNHLQIRVAREDAEVPMPHYYSQAQQLIDRARAALADEPAVPAPPADGDALPEGYIDPEHSGDDRALLETYYAACQAEGGTADDITLRGLRAVLDRWGSPAPEMVAVTEESWDALVNRLWGNYETIGHQGERFMYEADFCTALDIARQEIDRWVNPAPAPPADGEVAELVSKLQKLCADLDYDDRGDDAGSCYRAAELLQRQALVPVAVSERLPGTEDCNAKGRCWCFAPQENIESSLVFHA